MHFLLLRPFLFALPLGRFHCYLKIPFASDIDALLLRCTLFLLFLLFPLLSPALPCTLDPFLLPLLLVLDVVAIGLSFRILQCQLHCVG